MSSPVPSANFPAYATGWTRLTVQRNGTTPLLVDVWYPAAASSSQSNEPFGRRTLSVARDAPCAAANPKLFVALSHAAMARADDYTWLTAALAGSGIAVVAVHHKGESSAYAQVPLEPGVSLQAAKRAAEVRTAIDAAQTEPHLSACLANRSGLAVGHGVGAHTALTLLGARPDFTSLAEYCSSVFTTGDVGCQEVLSASAAQLEALRSQASCDSGRDPRLQGAWLLDPSRAPSFSPETLASLGSPIFISDVADAERPHEAHTKYLLRHAPRALLDEATKRRDERASKLNGHATWLDACDQRASTAEHCDDPPGLDQRALQTELLTELKRFAATLAEHPASASEE